jgi:hypothetical protein
MYIVGDYRKQNHKGLYALFWKFHIGDEICDIYSSLRIAKADMELTRNIPQSLHNSSGRLIAYTHNGKVVHCHA